jgi:alkylhydroperoxidase family enzyme
LAILQVGYVTGSAYEWTHHIKLARDEFGVSDDDVRAVATETAGGDSGLGSLERAALRAAREMTDELRASDEAFAVLQAELSPEHLIDLVMTIAFYNLVVRVLHTLEIDVEPEYQGLLDDYPLPEVPT